MGVKAYRFFFVFLPVSQIERACTTLRSGRILAAYPQWPRGDAAVVRIHGGGRVRTRGGERCLVVPTEVGDAA